MTASPTRRQLVFLLGSLLLAPLVTLYATQAVWLQSLWAPLPWMASHGGATVLFWVLFSSLSLTLYGFFRRLFPAYLPEVAVFMGVAVTSRYKLDINGAPLQLSDFAFVGNLGDITGYAASQLIPTLTTLLAIGVAAVLTETLRRKETWRPSLTQGFVLGSLCLTLFLSALYPGALQSAALRLDQNSPDQETRNERMGVVLGLYTAWAQRLQVETGTADPETTRLVDQLRADAMGPGTPAPAAAPDIIFVTSESFFDVTRLPGLTFSQDPLPNFHRRSGTCTNGPFLSNTYGGGTGHVEMEMFTGLTSSLLKEGDTLNTLHSAVYQDLPSTVRLLQKAGYATTALHAHTSELYNRETIYPAIGFDTVAFLDDFLTPVEIAGKYASDDSFARELIARYEARDPSQPVFLYGMSMENHQTYTPEKYGQPSGFPAQCDKLSQEDLAILDALVMGLHHADASLGLLTDYFSQVDRPVMLVFVGDHLPSLNLSDGVSLYTHLGYSPTEEAADWDPGTLENILSTDYLIWTNYEAQAAPDRMESCTFLGLHTLQRAGIPLNQYFSWLDREVASHMLLSRRTLFVDQDGKGTYSPSQEDQAILEQYTAVERNLLYRR